MYGYNTVNTIEILIVEGKYMYVYGYNTVNTIEILIVEGKYNAYMDTTQLTP